jgi:steroid delta-isomerase-like uncharacterized protein
MAGPDSPEQLNALIERYNDAWNRQDVEAITSMHTDDIVFHNHTAGERVEGAVAVGEHIAGIFRGWPGMRFTGRTLYVRDGLVVQEWTATGTQEGTMTRAGIEVPPTGRKVDYRGMDVIPIRDGLVARKDVYSDSVTLLRQLGLTSI